MKHKIEYINVDKLSAYETNSRTHSDDQIKQIADSIKEFGFTNPVLIDQDGTIIAGHGRVQAAKKIRMDEVPCIRLSHLTEAQRKAYVIADNKLALNAGWDDDLLKSEIEALQMMDFDIDLLGFDQNELNEIIDLEDGEEENPYTQKVESPNYEPVGDKPDISELYEDGHALGLIEDIKNSKLPEKEKKFLMAAASRHIIFDYGKVANYYAHSNAEVQKLMEDSALVIIDFNKAIEQGYVKLNDRLNEIFANDSEAHGDEE
jgi:hypothetical protein